jgi:hypothetical protein
LEKKMVPKQKEVLGTDINGKVDYSLPQMSYGQGTTVTSSPQTFTTPPNFNRAFFSYYGGAVFVSFGGTATVYGGSVADTTSELMPSSRQISVRGGETISVVSPTTAYVGIRYDVGKDN